MAANLTSFSVLLFTGLALVPAAAHLLELPNKIALPQQKYWPPSSRPSWRCSGRTTA